MKNALLLLWFLVYGSPNVLSAQGNLVSNPSFEEMIECPIEPDQLNYATGWSIYRESPDYFSICSGINSIVGLPINFAGHQNPKHGSAYAGVITHTSFFPFDYREYLGIKLSEPLLFNNKYFASVFISRADTVGYDCATNNFGFRFSTIPYSIINPASIGNFSHIHSSLIIVDKENWTLIQGSFIADSSYEYLILGNFYDELHTDTATGNHPGQYYGYYYIDGVCVSTDSVYSISWTGLKGNESDLEIAVFPNPCDDYFHIRNSKNRTSYSLYNTVGKIVSAGIVEKYYSTIDVSAISNGIYELRVNETSFTKILINH